jgi:hypothetical protein
VALWRAMDGLEGLRNVNYWEGMEKLREGGLETTDLGNSELAVAAALFLPRSASTLTALDAR